MLRRSIAIATLSCAACSGSNDTPSTSGLPENAQVTSLSDADLQTLCTWAADYEGGAGTTLACNETVNGLDQCTAAIRAATDCPVKVSQFEECAHALRADPCAALGDSGCSALALCAMR